MVSLATAGLRFDSIMQTSAGYPFRGTIEQLDEGSIAPSDFTVPRLILRVQPTCPVVTGAVIVDPAGRRFLLADQDVSFAYNRVEYRTHRLFAMNRQLVWERETSTVDPLTNLARSSGKQTIDTIWCLVDRLNAEGSDSIIRVKEERKRVVTAYELRLGDILDGMIVKRIDPVLGVWVAEVQ